ncbi:hypothetical protein ACB092_05G024900 [Castanea dentata]
MQFDSLDDVETFYKEFAKKEAFGIRIRIHTSKKAPRSDNVTSCIYVCCSQGQRKTKNALENGLNKDDENKARRSCSSLRTGCEAMLRVMKNNKLQKWVVKGFDNNHNHGIISPKIEKFGEEGLPIGKVAMMFNVGDQTFTSRDCWNHLSDVRGKNLDVGDASAVLNYCQNNKLKTPISFMQLNVMMLAIWLIFFWVDERSRMAYQYFGDYDMPFAPFTGLNHHCQSILFGCALLQDETEQTFVWLFETWLQAMWGKEPKPIITDQDLAMGAAIAKVFPRTRHRLCLWVIKKKFPEKLSHIYHKKSIFKRELKRCIRESPSVEKFEEAWKNLILTYGLERNEWLEGLYNIRESWVPVYNRNTFFARMNTTQRSESINVFFDSFVNSRTTLKDFVVKFAKAMDSHYKKERKEDFDSRHKTPSLVIGSKIEHQAASIYTRTILSKFQKELVSSNHFTKEKVEKNGTFYRYKVTSSFDPNDSFIVNLNLESKVCECDCQLFEFMGIVCRHMLLIFQDEHHMSRALRSIHVCQCVSQLSYLTEKSEDIYKMIISNLDHTLKKAFGMENELLEDKEDDEMDMHRKSGELADIVEVEDCSVIVPLNIKDPHVSQTKGRKKSTEKQGPSGRIKGGLKISLAHAMTKRRSCQLRGVMVIIVVLVNNIMAKEVITKMKKTLQRLMTMILMI